MNYKKLIAQEVSKLVEVDIENIEKLIEIPPQSEMGDYAFPCFQFAKTLRKAPNLISADLKEKLQIEGIDKIENVGPYLNFFVNKEIFSKNTIEKILKEKESYGSCKVGEGKNVIVEYSSPNIAKPFHVGHLFSTAVGHSLYEILKFQGYNCTRINHVGDWGTQFGKLISAYKRWVDEEALEKDPIPELLRIYVKFHDAAEENPELETEARAHFKNLEDGKEFEVGLWKKFKDLSLKEFAKVYDLLGVEFDSYAGESFYSDKMPVITKAIEDKGILTDSNGAKVVMLDDYNMPPCIIKKSDGATIYATRDLAAAKYRKDEYDFHKNIYVVGKDQSLHFKQIFTTLKLMEYDWADDCIHVPFGLVRFADKKLSTRKGDVILLEELLKGAIDKTIEIINEKNPNLKNKEEAAKTIGIGSVIFTYLKNSREKDIVFNWGEMLSFDGETAPYVQYTYARGKSILNKVSKSSVEADFSLLNSKEEFELVKQLSNFSKAINYAADKLEPSVISRYVLDVAKYFNKFYNSHNIANTEDEKLKNARIELVESTCQVIENALKLLGIGVVQEM
ncbi:arginine--tRNA ligase [Hathewaya histolytica]|uniref:Arginine--tRNA ligase n=1 Tax=Hathewaya histolytica TaxID=1498 RepID=A0A4U9R675_HATHI|nr:arginine--tRNA ligase [Hathewaya histolytica]VTQ86556.1 arginyl-tRNA synthetase [Hathewaya histolytica]